MLDAAGSVQDYLNLSAPGGRPANPGLASVTIQSLLEHTSGLNDDTRWNDGPTVVAAFNNAGIPTSLPVTEEMTDALIATLSPESALAKFRSTAIVVTTSWAASSPSWLVPSIRSPPTRTISSISWASLASVVPLTS
jgi:CubicO group peptidase (beta-lactamase class C family)